MGRETKKFIQNLSRQYGSIDSTNIHSKFIAFGEQTSGIPFEWEMSASIDAEYRIEELMCSWEALMNKIEY